MDFEKRSVRLADIVPSGTNPRRDFGDIDGLAEAIRATGGEPVNPPVVVEDGNVYRIVDGERRYRALSLLYKGHGEVLVPVLVASDMDGADELVAMLATDDKRQLDEEERARGVQQMLVLGVDTVRAARAARTTGDKVAALGRASKMAPEGVQVTLDQALAACRMPDAYAERVLAAEDWERAAADCEREIRLEEDKSLILEAVEAAGWEVSDEGYPDGYVYGGTVRPKTAAEDVERLSAEGCTMADIRGGQCWAYRPRADGTDAEEEAREAEVQRMRDEDAEACRSMAESMVGFIIDTYCGGIGEPGGTRRPLDRDVSVSEKLADEAAGLVARILPNRVRNMAGEGGEDGAPGPVAVALARVFPYRWAAVTALLDMVAGFREGTYLYWGDGRSERALLMLSEAYDLMLIEGWEPTDADRAKRTEVRDAMDAADEG